jgi:hypothetical protein
LAVPAWEVAVRHDWRAKTRSYFVHLSVGITFAVAWTLAQYALNPFRARSTLGAMSVSRSLPWQLLGGLSLYAVIVAVAYALHSAREVRRVEEERQLPLPEAVQTAVTSLDRLFIRTGNRTVVVPADEIERLQGWDDHVAVYTKGRRLLASHRLNELAERLDASRFLRVHRSHIVNLAFVRDIERVDPNRVRAVMGNGDRVPASRAGSLALRKLTRQLSLADNRQPT